MPLEEALLTARRGTVTAPAGCGKTHLIADALRQHREKRPILVLTHTNAGVTAIRQRFQRLEVPSSVYRVSTIDALGKRLAGMFSERSGINPNALELNNPKVDYPAIQRAAIQLLEARHLDDALAATYARLIVDEYQDCSLGQHRIVVALANVLPTCVLGDPMQAIFGFAGQRVDWTAHVLNAFPAVGELNIPWRWINAQAADLGQWLLEARQTLSAGNRVDLRTLPNRVEYVAVAPGQDDLRRQTATHSRPATRDGSVLIMGDAKNVAGRLLLASQIPGATVVERVDLPDLTDFSRRFDLAAVAATSELLAFAGTIMTNLNAQHTLQRIETLRGGRARTPPTPIEQALLTFEEARTFRAAHAALERMRAHPGARIYRHEVLHRCLRSLEASFDGQTSFYDASLRERERFRLKGRPLGQRNVGSTLLLKGLEAEVVVILHPEEMDARNLYVAMTRASHRIVICSRSPMLPL